MKAVVLKAYGDVDQLSYEDVETPQPGPGEVLVKIAATSVNPVDYKLRSGSIRQRMPIDLPAILGRDVAGEVVESGPGADSFRTGQRVMALGNHTYAEYAVVKADSLVKIPEGLGFEQAAALPLIATTGAQLIEQGVKPKSSYAILVTGALGSVGRTAVHVAAEHHAQVIAGVKSSQLAEAESLGTLAVVPLDDEQAVAKFTELDGIADTVGGPVGEKLLKVLRHGGTYASVVGPPQGADHHDIQIEQVYAQPDAARLARLAEDVAEGRFTIPIAKVMKLSEIREAHRLAESGGMSGKIILIP